MEVNFREPLDGTISLFRANIKMCTLRLTPSTLPYALYDLENVENVERPRYIQIYNGLDNKENILIVFLDISKACDRVWYPGLLHKLCEFGISGPLYSWITSYLSERCQKVVIGQNNLLLNQQTLE